MSTTTEPVIHRPSEDDVLSIICQQWETSATYRAMQAAERWEHELTVREEERFIVSPR